ncbi:c-type cytochrome [Novosphingobium marinum]|uniref:Cytochrome c553 n=1 Tax=Novosphingobium marinum TaxID=1514948 RepID=A0A7Z0BTZ1_9SPHN|nr:hypothetical protein [Novosphingobium marinum]NYH93757.1 cytochrome c553 [Novosphingobium marinum]
MRILVTAGLALALVSCGQSESEIGEDALASTSDVASVEQEPGATASAPASEAAEAPSETPSSSAPTVAEKAEVAEKAASAAGKSAPAEPEAKMMQASATTSSGKSYYEENVAPIFASACATCHLTGTEAGNISLVPRKAVANLVNVASTEAPNLKRVVPGKPDASYLIMKLEGTHLQNGGSGLQMPFGVGPLSKDQIAKVRTWIAQGAKP